MLEDWKKAIIDQDAVIHLASETGTGQSCMIYIITLMLMLVLQHC